MFVYSEKPGLKKLWSQACEPGSSSIEKPARQFPQQSREIIVFVTAFILFGLFSVGGTPDRAVAAPGISGKSGQYAQNERGNLRHFVHSNPDNFLRLKGRDIAFAMSTPELVRYEFPSVVWQYRTGACVLDVYFASMDEDVSNAPVIHYEIRAREKTIPDAGVFKGCIDQLTAQENPLVMAKASSFYKHKLSDQ